MAEKGDEALILDLSNKNLKKLEKSDGKQFHTLVLDKNSLAKLDNIDTYNYLQKLSVEDNDLVRMYAVAKLTSLRILNLADNNIVCIEGLKELIHMTWLNLSGNNIKNIDHLNSNVNLEHLDLSDNNISHLSDISCLKSLKALLLHKNKIPTLRYASNYIPISVEIFSISENCLTDINEVSYLCGLSNLEQLSVANNPCFIMTGENIGFDYRPFVINWCLHLRILDGYVVSPKESLKAEWLYSQGKGRHFHPGEHSEVVSYLAQVCSMASAEDLQTEEDAKLARILNKQKQHQLQLLEELSRSQPGSPNLSRSSAARATQSPSPSLRRKPMRKVSPKPFCTSDKDNKRTSPNQTQTNNSYQLYPVELPAGLYDLDMENQSCSQIETSKPGKKEIEAPLRPQSLFSKTNVMKSTSASDVSIRSVSESEVCQFSNGLHTETHYVPVPETMLSPDFRPLNTSPRGGYNLSNGELIPTLLSNKENGKLCTLPSTSPGRLSARSPSNQNTTGKTDIGNGINNAHVPQDSQGSPIRQHDKKLISQGNPMCFTDSPLLRRTAALRKLTKHKLLHLNSSRKRSSSLRLGIESASSAESLSENDSTDSEISISKLAHVKEIAATRKIRKFLKKSPQQYLKEASIINGKFQKPNAAENLKSFDLLNKKPNICEKLEKTENGKTLNGGAVQNKLLKECIESVDKVIPVDDENIKNLNKSAAIIQAAWKGFQVRKLDPAIKNLKEELRQRRMEEHVNHLISELEQTRHELEQERQLRSLQIETIRALWKEVQVLQSLHVDPSLSANQDNIAKSSAKKSSSQPILDKLLSSYPILNTYIKGEEKNAQKEKSLHYSDESNGESKPGNEPSVSSETSIQSDKTNIVPSDTASSSKVHSPEEMCKSNELVTLTNDIVNRDVCVETEAFIKTGEREDVESGISGVSSMSNSEFLDNSQTSIMVRQLTRTCNDLTHQVNQLQEALQIVYKAVFSSGSVTPFGNQSMVSMVQSVSSEASACSCHSTSSLPNPIELTESNIASASMVSSMMSSDSNADFGQVLENPFTLKNTGEEASIANDQIENVSDVQPIVSEEQEIGVQKTTQHPVNGFSELPKSKTDTLTELQSRNDISDIKMIAPPNFDNAYKPEDNNVSDVSVLTIIQNKEQFVSKSQLSPHACSKPLSKIGAYLPGLTNDRSPKDHYWSGDFAQCIDAGKNMSPENKDEKCVIKVQVMQAKLIEIEEITPVDCPLKELEVDGNGDGKSVSHFEQKSENAVATINHLEGDSNSNNSNSKELLSSPLELNGNNEQKIEVAASEVNMTVKENDLEIGQDTMTHSLITTNSNEKTGKLRKLRAQLSV